MTSTGSETHWHPRGGGGRGGRGGLQETRLPSLLTHSQAEAGGSSSAQGLAFAGALAGPPEGPHFPVGVGGPVGRPGAAVEAL